MTFSADTLTPLSFPIAQGDRALARRFAAEQPNPRKAQQVYRNTLAVLSTSHYLQILGIETDWQAADSWNPAIRFFADVADLPIVGYGSLECRPVNSDTSFCDVPAEVQDDRLGYVIVAIDEEAEAATFLGFTQTVSADAIAISQLQPFEQLLDYCSRSYPVQSAFANLRSWLDNTVEAGWQSVETLFTPDPQLLPVRGQAVADSPIDTDDITDIAPVLRLLQPNQAETIRRHAASVLGEIGQDNPEAISALVNLIENTQDEETRWQASLSLGKLSPHHPLAGIRQAKHLEIAPGVEVLFIISLMPKPQNRLGVDVQIEATQPASVLPANLTLSVIADGETRTTVTTRSDDRGVGTDRSMRRRFTPPPGTEFQVKVQWGDDETIETFVA